MTADSPAVAEARRVARLRRLAGDVDVAEVLDGLLAELGAGGVQDGSAAVGPGTVYPPSGGSSLSGDARGSQSASGSDATSPAERLRAAADLVEQRTAAATPGPWLPEWTYTHSRVQAVFVECDGEDCEHDRYAQADGTCSIGSFELDPDNRWALLAGPQIGPHLAAWLRATAGRAERLAFGHLACDEALALADAILGGDAR